MPGMHSLEDTLRLPPVILLIGICSCVSVEHDEQVDEQVDEQIGDVDVSGPTEIDSNEPETAQTSTNSLRADFNGDGFADLAIGAPNDDISGVASGSVNVLYGSVKGLSVTGEQIFFRGRASSLLGVAESGEAFGGDEWILK